MVWIDEVKKVDQNVPTWEVVCKVVYTVSAKDHLEARLIVDEYNADRIDEVKMEIVEIRTKR